MNPTVHGIQFRGDIDPVNLAFGSEVLVQHNAKNPGKVCPVCNQVLCTHSTLRDELVHPSDVLFRFGTHEYIYVLRNKDFASLYKGVHQGIPLYCFQEYTQR